jgi:hypothetical protein
MTERFRVSTTRSGRRRDVQFVVYDDVADLQRAGARYRDDADGFLGALGISQPRSHATVLNDGSLKLHRAAGVIRLWKGDMGAAVLAHECFHMALAIYREDFTFPWNPLADRIDDEAMRSLAVMDNEEVLCHIASDLVRAANRKLWKLGVYS